MGSDSSIWNVALAAALALSGAGVLAAGFFILRTLSWSAIPRNLRAAWPETAPLLAIGAFLIFASGVACEISVAEGDNANIVFSFLGVGGFYGLLFGSIVTVGGLGYFCLQAFVSPQSGPGLDTVRDQRVHDTGDWAKERDIDAALREQDVSREVAPQFED